MRKKMKLKNRFGYLELFILIILTPNIHSLTIQELIDSYSYNYNDGTMYLLSYNDQLTDTDSNGINDRIIINLTINSTQADYFEFYVDLVDQGNTISNRTNVSVSAGVSNVTVSFDTRLLTKNKYNYSVRIYNKTNTQIFSQYNIETQFF